MKRLSALALAEVTVRNGLRAGGSRAGTLVEVVWVENPDGLFSFTPAGDHVEFGLGQPPCGMEEGRLGGLADAGEMSGDALRVGENPSEAEFVKS